MSGRVADKIAIVVGAGQTPGETIGNGRATAIVLAREGATVVVADRNLASAQDTVDLIAAEGGQAIALSVDATDEESVQRLIAETLQRYGRLDILHNNVGASIMLGDAPRDAVIKGADREESDECEGIHKHCQARPGRRRRQHQPQPCNRRRRGGVLVRHAPKARLQTLPGCRFGPPYLGQGAVGSMGRHDVASFGALSCG
jgi:hypothetical protein